MTPATEHILDPAAIHHDWDKDREAVLSVRSGDVVHVDLAMAGRGQVAETSVIEDVVWDFETIYNLAGPVRIEGARAGDVLEVELLELTPGPWGWTAIMPELGLLPEDFPDPYLKIWDLRDRTAAALTPTVKVPLAPFLGTIGVPPAVAGALSPFPPHMGGGNIDNRHLVAGTSVWLPVWTDGALFSCGDPHAAQGDGEVCVSAIECDMKASLRLSVRPGPISSTRSRVTTAARPSERVYQGTMGIDGDLYEAARKAVRSMIAWIVDERALSAEDAYVLTSVAGDLHIHEIVDAGVWNVGMTLPLDVFH
jgi:acetamidase/formamidase